MNYGRKEKMTTSWEIVVKSSEEFPISLAFTPTGVRGSSAKLHIRHAGTSIKYSVRIIFVVMQHLLNRCSVFFPEVHYR